MTPWIAAALAALLAAAVAALAAALAARKRAEARLSAVRRVSGILAASSTLDEAVPELCRAVCETLGWDFGAVWRADAGGASLRCIGSWRARDVPAPEFEKLTQARTFGRGVGLPGRVWETARPAWISDVVRDGNFPRAEVAAREGLHAAFGFPIAVPGDVVGVIEFFSRRIRAPDRSLLDLMSAVGGLVGQFVMRREAEADLRRSEEELADFFENAALPMHWVDEAGVIRRANRAELELLGYPREEYVGRPVADFHADADTIASILGSLRDGRDVCCRSARLVRKDGTLRDVVIDSSGLWREGRFVHTRCITRDVTEPRRTEQALRESEERHRALAEELRENHDRKDDFLATLAHELRNPLAPLSNALQLIRLAGTDASLRTDALALADRQLRTLVRLVDDLLDVSRLTRGKIRLQTERVSLEDVVARAVETARPTLDTRRARLQTRLPEDAVLLDADPTRLAQAVANLIDNAARYGPEGGLVRLGATVEGSVLTLTVEDDGIGIAAADLPRLFVAFQQAGDGAGRAHGGPGLGLALVKHLVELHGGSVEASSEGPGRGSRFTVRLPLPAGDAVSAQDAAPSKPREPAPAAPSPVGPPSNGRRRILVVDDNVDSARTMALLLRKSGNDVECAHDGLAAVAATESFAPDVILLDLGLPGIDGYEAARRIRGLPRGAEIRVIALTGWGQAEDRRRTQEAGFDQHVVKPVDPALLRKLIG